MPNILMIMIIDKFKSQLNVEIYARMYIEITRYLMQVYIIE